MGDVKFDLIFHYFVLEHVGDPLSFLTQQIDLLNPGGLLEFELPSGNEALLEVYNLNSFRDFYFQVGHQWVFTPDATEFFCCRRRASMCRSRSGNGTGWQIM